MAGQEFGHHLGLPRAPSGLPPTDMLRPLLDPHSPLLRQLEWDFAELSLFGLSGPRPVVRVEDPLLWPLSRRGPLPVHAAGKRRAK